MGTKSGMSVRVGIATSVDHPQLIDDDRLFLPYLAARGIATEPAIWNDPAVDWRRFDAVVIRSTWDYYERIAEFRLWLDGLIAAGVTVWNPVPTVLRNADKTYLRELEKMGVLTLPTVWIAPGEAETIASVLKAVPWQDLVAKPSISAGAYRTVRCSKRELEANPGLIATIIADSHAMIQPFMQEIVDEGEWSFLFFGEELSHAVVKKPKPGDFRVQYTHGGKHVKAEPPEALAAAVAKVFALIPEPPRLFTRVDGIWTKGRFLCIEIEMIEPVLFLAEDKESPVRFAKALADLLR